MVDVLKEVDEVLGFVVTEKYLPDLVDVLKEVDEVLMTVSDLVHVLKDAVRVLMINYIST